MKKILSIVLLSVVVATGAFAQKKNVKKAYNLSMAYENPDFDQAEMLIDQALNDPSTANDPYTWWVAGHIQDRKIFWENEKEAMGGSRDLELQAEAAFRAYDYFIKAAELEKLPNAKGKIVNKYTKKIAETLAWYYRGYFIFNYGLRQAEYESYDMAVQAIDKHLAIPDLEFMKDYRGNENAPKPQKDSTYRKIQFYNAIYVQSSGNTDEAIARFEAIKNNGVEESVIYQNLYNLYKDKKDSVNMDRILVAGIDRFPEELVFLGLKINTYLEKGQSSEALVMLNKAIERNPKNAQYYTIRGQVYRDLNNATAAMQDYDKAITLDPTKPVYYYNKGEFLFFRGTDAANAATDPANRAIAQNLAAESSRYFNDAKAAFNKILDIEPDNKEALVMLRRIAVRENNQAEINRLTKLIDKL